MLLMLNRNIIKSLRLAFIATRSTMIYIRPIYLNLILLVSSAFPATESCLI